MNRTRPIDVVSSDTFGGCSGYSGGRNMSNAKQPLAYGVPSGPKMRALRTSGLSSSTRTKMDDAKLSGSDVDSDAISRVIRLMRSRFVHADADDRISLEYLQVHVCILKGGKNVSQQFIIRW